MAESDGLYTGKRGSYFWLTSDRANMNAVLRACPQAVLGKHIAITTYDSGMPRLSSEDAEAGWEIDGGIAYSPRIRAAADLPSFAQLEPAALFQEWYVFSEPVRIGPIWRGNVFTRHADLGGIVLFVNFMNGFELYAPEVQEVTDLFWKQLERLQPESFFGEGQPCLTFVTRDAALFEDVLDVVRRAKPFVEPTPPFYYDTGEEILAGDQVMLDGEAGVVDLVTDTAGGPPCTDGVYWENVSAGYVVKCVKRGYVYLEEIERAKFDLRFVARAGGAQPR